MPHTTGLLIASTRCIRPAEEPAWADWYDGVHLPDLVAPAGGPWVVTRFELAQRPQPGMPGLGFSHVTLYELDAADVGQQARCIAERDGALRREGRIHPAHAVVDAQLFAAHGPAGAKPEPGPELRGHILAHVLCNDPAQEADWDAWYDREHLPDMLEAGCFRALTRWRREPRPLYGTTHMTLYDVCGVDLDEAVARSAAVLARLTAAGRKHPAHAGALTLLLRPCGRYGAAGLRRPR